MIDNEEEKNTPAPAARPLRGFAALSPEQRREIASRGGKRGGKASHGGLANVSVEQRREIAALGGKASKGGFRAMSAGGRRNVAALGGITAHRNGHTHEWGSDEAREAGRISHPPARVTVYRSRSGKIFEERQCEDA